MKITPPDASPRLLCLLLLLSLAPGCAVLNTQPPIASFRAPSVAEISPAGVTADFDVAVQNPNSIDLPVEGADYKLRLGGVEVVDGQATPSGAIPAKGDGVVTIPVHLRFDRLLQAKKAIASSNGDVPFDFEGALEFAPGKIPLGKSIKVPLHFSGTLGFRDALGHVVRDPATWADLLRDPSSRKFMEAALGHKVIGAVLER